MRRRRRKENRKWIQEEEENSKKNRLKIRRHEMRRRVNEKWVESRGKGLLEKKKDERQRGEVKEKIRSET